MEETIARLRAAQEKGLRLNEILIEQPESILISEDLPQALFQTYLNRQFGTVEEDEGVIYIVENRNWVEGNILQNPLSKK